MADVELDPAVPWTTASESLIRRVTRFAQLVRSEGITVTSGRVIDAQRSLAYIDVGRRDDFYHALRANLIAGPEDIPRFDVAFNRFWGVDGPPENAIAPPEVPADDPGDSHQSGERSVRAGESGERPRRGDEAEDEGLERTAGSPVEVLLAKDFGSLDSNEIREMGAIVAHMAPKLLTVRSRRFQPGPAGSQLDFRRTLRQSARTGGTVVDLAWRKRRLDTARLVLLCDVSHSMERYSRFLIQFMYAFQNELPNTETFIFSTRLTRLTGVLRGRYLDDAVRRATSASAGWSSGTRIGDCLQEFNRHEGAGLLDRRTVAVILSDGWDQGEPDLLGAQLAAIKRRSRLVIWLNPLLGDPRYRPLVTGMRAALPHIDLFLPCHNLQSLQAFAAELRKL